MTRMPTRSANILWALYILFLIAGCSTQNGLMASIDSENRWSGRLVLRADAQPPLHVTAAFELVGSAEQGSMSLSTPLGTTLATAHWQPGLAELRGMGYPKVFDTLDELTEAMMGTPLPIHALFAWLDGQPQTADGWLADLREVHVGRLNARRMSPPPSIEIRLVFEPLKKLTP